MNKVENSINQIKEKITAIRDLIQLEINRIVFQLDSAKAKVRLRGEYSDSDWYGRASSVLRSKRVQVQILTRKLQELKTLEKREYNNQVERRFIEVAKRRLDRELFLSFMVEAKDLAMLGNRDLTEEKNKLFTPREIEYLQNQYGDYFIGEE